MSEPRSGECVSVDMLRRRRSLKPENQRYYSRDWYRRAAVAFRDESDRLRAQLAGRKDTLEEQRHVVLNIRNEIGVLQIRNKELLALLAVAERMDATTCERLAAAEAVCGYDAMHRHDCGMWQPGKARNLDECTCGLRAAHDKWQALRGGDDDDRH